MSAIVCKIISGAIISIMGLIVVKNISGAKEKILSKKSILLMILLIVITAVIYSMNYNYVYSIVIYILTIITYKEILNISLVKAILSCAIMLLTLLVIDSIALTILALFITMNQLRNTWYLNISMNILFSIILIITFNINKIKETLPTFIEKMENKKVIKIIIMIIVALIVMSVILNTMSNHFSINDIFTTNFMLIIFFFSLIMLLIGERSNLEILSDEYDNLFKYVQIFEDWIEKEQLTRHEYKNQLAILRNLTKEKKVKDKIDSIVDDFINIDNEMITQLKNIPNGGLKGLLYYKISIAKKNKINLTVDIDDKAGRDLSKITDEKQKSLTKLLGIYLDNAIEASVETKKKIVTIEIYQLKEEVKVVISNSFNNKNDISSRNKKGVSTKGSGRGNGLYFASELISKNKWIKEKQEVIDDFYIQNLIIKKV